MSSTRVRAVGPAPAAALAMVAAVFACADGTVVTRLPDPHTDPATGPAAGNPDAPCAVPADALAEDVTTPATVVGTGTPASCTGEAFVAAVEKGGIVTFDCGPDPVVVTVPRTAKVRNDRHAPPLDPRVVIDGGGKVTLSGAGASRILYMNTCDSSLAWTTSHCQDQDHPRLTVQNVTFVDGNAVGTGEGGGAVFARGGRFKAVNARFFHSWCDVTGPDVGGGAIRVFDQWQDLPAYVVGSTFGGSEALGNFGSNGRALSSIGVSWTVLNSVFGSNAAIGSGANPQRAGTPGGGSGGAIYADGNTMTVTLCGVRMTGNTAREGGGAVFFVSNDLTGHLVVTDSVLSGNPSAGFETPGYPGIFYLGSGPPLVTRSTIR
jgi:hypothetical protein